MFVQFTGSKIVVEGIVKALDGFIGALRTVQVLQGVDQGFYESRFDVNRFYHLSSLKCGFTRWNDFKVYLQEQVALRRPYLQKAASGLREPANLDDISDEDLAKTLEALNFVYRLFSTEKFIKINIITFDDFLIGDEFKNGPGVTAMPPRIHANLSPFLLKKPHTTGIPEFDVVLFRDFPFFLSEIVEDAEPKDLLTSLHALTPQARYAFLQMLSRVKK